ncbi:MAG: dockerin type I domain-containing protein, partial [Bacillota bacterium]
PAYFVDEATVRLDAVGPVEMRQFELVGGDTKRDGLIDIFDIVLIGAAYNAEQGEERYDARADINRDGVVDLQDLTVAAFYFNRAGSHAPGLK